MNQIPMPESRTEAVSSTGVLPGKLERGGRNMRTIRVHFRQVFKHWMPGRFAEPFGFSFQGGSPARSTKGRQKHKPGKKTPPRQVAAVTLAGFISYPLALFAEGHQTSRA